MLHWFSTKLKMKEERAMGMKTIYTEYTAEILPTRPTQTNPARYSNILVSGPYINIESLLPTASRFRPRFPYSTFFSERGPGKRGGYKLIFRPKFSIFQGVRALFGLARPRTQCKRGACNASYSGRRKGRGDNLM